MGTAAMSFIRNVLRILVLVAVVCVNVVQVQPPYWPPAPLQNHPYWQPYHSNIFYPRAQKSQQLPSTDEPLTDTTTLPYSTSVPTTAGSTPAVQENKESSPNVQEKPEQKPGQFGPRQPSITNGLAVKCGEKAVIVEVKQDFYGTGQFVDSSAVTLGGCEAEEVDFSAGVLVFQSPLEGCNSLTTMTDEALIYAFNLTYKPAISPGSPVVRKRGATVNIECHYLRKHNVSSNRLIPTWTPFVATAVAEEVLIFSLQLMSDDWASERDSDEYFLGDVMNIEASVLQVNHMDLLLFVDSCVATGSSNASVVPRYSFIGNYGCFTDGKIANSSFLPRTRSSSLQFQLETFQFQDDSGPIYINCLLKATTAVSPTDEEHKACSFQSNRWVSSDGSDRVCGCCDESCGYRRSRDLAMARGLQWEGKTTIGPLYVKEI